MTYFCGLTVEFWAAVAGILSLLLSIILAVYNYQKNKHKANTELNTELNALISALIGFIDFVQNTFFHNTATLEDCLNIVKKIKSLDKNILDCNKKYFYDDEYDEKVLQKTTAFIQQYAAWKGYHCAIDLDVFSEMNFIIALQSSAIETISAISSAYKGKNNRISSLITDDNRAVMKHIDEQNKIKADCFRAVENNLYFIENQHPLITLYKIKEKQEFPLSNLIAACYKVIAQGKFFYPLNQKEYLGTCLFFFNSEITTAKFYDDKYGNHEYCFINEKGEKMEIDKIFNLLHFIANNE